MKHIIQPIAQQIQFWEFMGGSSLVQAATYQCWVRNTRPLGCPSQFILWQPRAVNKNFQEKELDHVKCSTLGFERLFVAT